MLFSASVSVLPCARHRLGLLRGKADKGGRHGEKHGVVLRDGGETLRVLAVQGVSETLARGNVKNIVVSMEDRMGGRKHLTHLSHVEGFGLDPDELAAVLQKKWSTSCSVTKLPGKTETGKMLDLQGNLLKVPATSSPFLQAPCTILQLCPCVQTRSQST